MKGKYLISLIFCNFYRLLRIFPNNDPIMGFTLPLACRGKWWHALFFPIIAMVSFDIITMKVGVWTAGTALVYGSIGLLFYKYFRKKKIVSLKTYAGSSIIGVLIFDFLTGPVMSSFMFGIPFSVAFIGQIPFTAFHLASATTFTILLAPVLDPQIAKDVNAKTTEFSNRLRSLIGIYKKVMG